EARAHPGQAQWPAPGCDGTICGVGLHRSAGGRDAQFLLDLGDRTFFFVEEFVLDFAPAAEFGDLEEGFFRGGELFRVDQLLVDRAVTVFGPDFLAFVRPRPFQEVFGCGLRGFFGDRDRGFDLQRVGRDDVFDVFAFLFRLDRFVLVGEEHVALALGEGGEGVATAARLGGGLFEHRLHRFQRLIFGGSFFDRRAVDGHDVPAGRAGAERVRRDHFDVFIFLQILEGFDAERVAFFDQDHDDRVGRVTAVRLFFPVFGDDFAFFDEPFHVAADREMDNRGGLAGRNRTALVTRGAERVAEADATSLRRFLEGRLEGVGVYRFRGRVADDTELGASRGASARVFPGGAGAGAASSATATGDDQSDQQGEGGGEADRHAAPPGGASGRHR